MYLSVLVEVLVLLAFNPHTGVYASDSLADRTQEDIPLKALLSRLENVESRDVAREKKFESLSQRLQATEYENKALHDRILALERQSETQHKEIKDLKAENAESKTLVTTLQNEIHSMKGKFDGMSTAVPKGARVTTNGDNSIQSDTESKGHPIERKELRQLLAKRENELNVAFFATLVNHIENNGVHQIVAFDTVVTNIGNGYNSHAGDFRAPVAGTYVFAVTMMSADSSMTYHYQVVRNGTGVSKIYIPNGGTASQEVVLQLQRGEDVAIHHLDAGHKLYGHSYTTFSGFLLQQDFSGPTVIGK